MGAVAAAAVPMAPQIYTSAATFSPVWTSGSGSTANYYNAATTTVSSTNG